MHQFFLDLQTDNKFTKIMPPIRRILHLLITAAAISAAVSCSERIPYHRIEGFAQGGTFHIIYSEPVSGVDEDTVISLVSRRLQDIDFSISGYNKGSLLSKFNRGEDVIPDRWFKELFEMSKVLWEESDGLFDVSGGPLFDFWGFGFTDPASLDSLRNDALTAHVVDSLLAQLQCHCPGLHLRRTGPPAGQSRRTELSGGGRNGDSVQGTERLRLSLENRHRRPGRRIPDSRRKYSEAPGPQRLRHHHLRQLP